MHIEDPCLILPLLPLETWSSNILEIDFGGNEDLTDRMVYDVLKCCGSLESLNLSRCTQLSNPFMTKLNKTSANTIKNTGGSGGTRSILESTVSMTTLPKNLRKIWVDGVWKIDWDTLMLIKKIYRGRLWIDMLDTAFLEGQVVQVVILPPSYFKGKWVDCTVTHERREVVRAQEAEGDRKSLHAYDIWVLPTNEYNQAVGYADSPAFAIKRKHLRHKCLCR